MKPIDMSETLRLAAAGESPAEVSRFAKALREAWAKSRTPAQPGTVEAAFHDALDAMTPDEQYPFLFPKEWLGWRLGRQCPPQAQ